tara:strand:+ start:97 stop:1035 length:939 start_codon:yes stop_codon:yes gene_type:complete
MRARVATSRPVAPLARRRPRSRASPPARARIDTDDLSSASSRLSRRALTALTALVPLLSRAPTARADDRVTECFFDVAVEDRALGRIVVEIDETSLSGRRFIQLCEGRRGLSYRRTTLDSIEVDDDENAVCVKNAGVGSFVTPGTNSAVDVVGGASAERAAEELNAPGRAKHDEGGLVSLIVRRDPNERVPEPKGRLVSVRGKFETVYDPPPPPPNGTGFAITLREAPELDATNVVVGRVTRGRDVLEAMSRLPTVKDNTSSPFFAVAKSIGDKRALVAELAFRKPFKKVVFKNCGVLPKAAPESTESESAE